MLYQVADYFFTLLHLVIILFNLLGWIWPRTRNFHLIVVCATLACWFILGIWFGIGYCPITDWQWRIKEKLGEQNLPASFIKYFADKLTGLDINSELVDAFTAIGFALAVLAAIYFRFIKKATVIH
jgi:hypothetical protein